MKESKYLKEFFDEQHQKWKKSHFSGFQPINEKHECHSLYRQWLNERNHPKEHPIEWTEPKNLDRD